MVPLRKEFVCRKCSKGYSSKYALDRHIMDHFYDFRPNVSFICIECCKEYTSPQKLTRHYYAAHKNMGDFTCKICKKKYNKKSSFNNHQRLQHGIYARGPSGRYV
jgi:tRNA(Ile2) C34 agmatinyltransferase TiaS